MNKQLIWIQTGYKTFAYEGPSGLKVERLSKSVGKNKSSFYHHFADLSLFTTQLLAFHLEQVKVIIAKEAMAKNAEELINVLLEHKIDFLFNRQLRIHRTNAEFSACFIKSNEQSAPAIMPVWKKIIGLDNHHYLAEMVYRLSLENFFLQITDETLNRDWLKTYFHTIAKMVQQFRASTASSKQNTLQ